MITELQFASAGVAAGVALRSKEISPLIGLEFFYEFALKDISFGPMVGITDRNAHEQYNPAYIFQCRFKRSISVI
jgi:hypothetical protein